MKRITRVQKKEETHMKPIVVATPDKLGGTRMKAIVNTTYGSPDVLQFKEVARPTPKDNEVLVQVHAASVNAAELHFLKADPFLMRFMCFGLLNPTHTILGAAMAGRGGTGWRNVKPF